MHTVPLTKTKMKTKTKTDGVPRQYLKNEEPYPNYSSQQLIKTGPLLQNASECKIC